jgi:hypothetical protein
MRLTGLMAASCQNQFNRMYMGPPTLFDAAVYFERVGERMRTLFFILTPSFLFGSLFLADWWGAFACNPTGCATHLLRGA